MTTIDSHSPSVSPTSPPAGFTPALLIVDLQEDFCPPNGSLQVPDGRSVVAPVNDLLNLPFVLKLATQDWHPLDHISFAANHSCTVTNSNTTLITHPTDPLLSYTSNLWPVHCVASTTGAALIPELCTVQLNGVIKKGTHSQIEMYSAFTDPFHSGKLPWSTDSKSVCTSELPKMLKEKNITDVFVVGLAMDYCVKATAMDAVRFGFRTWVVREGTKAVGGEEAWKTSEVEMVKNGVGMVDIDGAEVGWVKALARPTTV